MDRELLRKLPPLPRAWARRLTDPTDPHGRPIEWENPLLIMLAENGTCAANARHEYAVRKAWRQEILGHWQPRWDLQDAEEHDRRFRENIGRA